MAHRLCIPALDRSGQLGDLYDSHIDDFVSGNIFGNHLPDEVVRREDCPGMKYEFDQTNSYSSTFAKLNIEAGLKLSILSGILKVEGKGKYLSNISKTSTSNKTTLSLFMKRQREVLQLSFTKLASNIREEAFQNKSFTHVVTEVLWGANIFATFEQEKSAEDQRETIEGELKAELEKAGSFLAGGGLNAKVQAEGGTKTNVKNLHIEFSGDLDLPGIPTTIPQALNMISTIPESISKKNNGKGVQIQYILTPIQDILPYLSASLQSSLEIKIIREADQQLVGLIESTFDELLFREQQINRLVNFTEQYRESYLSDSDFTNMIAKKNVIGGTIHSFRRDLAILLKKLRTSKTSEQEKDLSEQINKLVQQQYNQTTTDTQTFLSEHKYLHKKCETVEQLKSKKVECLKIDATFCQSPNKDVYILITSIHLLKTEMKQFDEKLNEFTQLIDQNQNKRFVFHDQNDIQLTQTSIDFQPKTIDLEPNKASPENAKRKPCRWGSECHAYTKHHRTKYFHPISCNWIPLCTNHTDEHRKKYSHPVLCKWSPNCTNKTVEHQNQYFHPILCKWNPSCTDQTDHHRQRYSHP